MTLYTSGDIRSTTVGDLINIAKENRMEVSIRYSLIMDEIIFSVKDIDNIITFIYRVPLINLEDTSISFTDIFGTLIEKLRVAKMEVQSSDTYEIN